MGELRQLVLTALQQAADNYRCQGWKGIVEPADIVDYCLSEWYFLLDGEGGFVAYSVEQPWFSSERIICEELIHNIGYAKAAEMLEVQGRYLNCTRMVLGTRAVPRGKHEPLAKLFMRHGLAIGTIELTKEITP